MRKTSFTLFEDLVTSLRLQGPRSFFFNNSANEVTQRTLIRGPGDKLKIIASKKPISDIASPNIEDRIIAIHKEEACCKPNKVGVESNAITRMTPTADIELTMTRAVVTPRAKFKKDTFMPLPAAPSESNPICTSFS